MKKMMIFRGTVDVECPGNWTDEQIESVLDQVEDDWDAAVEALRNRIQEVCKDLTVEKVE